MSNREIFIDELKQLTHEEILERYIALLNTEKLTDYVADLEAKLSENKILMGKRISVYEKNFIEQTDEIYKLKQQLAEKEETIAEYKLYIESFKHSQDLDKQYISKLESDLAEKCRLLKTNETLLSGIKFVEKEVYQDKISFAVEQLEKVKNRIEINVESIYKRLDDLNINIVCESTSRQLDTYGEIVKEIDNQIKLLKEGK